MQILKILLILQILSKYIFLLNSIYGGGEEVMHKSIGQD